MDIDKSSVISNATIMNYYPTYSLLDEITDTKIKTLNIFVDLKNCLQSTYMEHIVLSLVNNTITTGKVDSSVFLSLLSFFTFHKTYAQKRSIKINFYIFFESGQSFYHLGIDKKYKFKRKIDNLYGLDRDKRDLFFSVLQKNYQLIENVCNHIPNIKVIRMENFEADFIPYYLISKNLVPHDDDCCNVIYSNDHDLLQVLSLPQNSIVYQKCFKQKRLVKKNNAVFRELKIKDMKEDDINIPDEYQPLAMSVIGDSSDCIDGIDKIGPKIFLNNFEDLKELIGGSMSELYNRIIHRKFIFNSQDETGNKYIDKIIKAEIENNRISRNLKLVSFYLISHEIDNPSSTEIIKRKDHIDKILNTSKIVNCQNLTEALIKSGVYILNDDLDMLYA